MSNMVCQEKVIQDTKAISAIKDFGKDYGVVHEAIITGRKVGAGSIFWNALAHNPSLFAKIVRIVELSSDLIEGMFISALQQLAIVHDRNLDRGWGFTKSDFDTLGEPPAWPKGRLCAIVLDVVLNTIQQTFDEAFYFARSVQLYSWHSEDIKSDSEHLKLMPGIVRQRGLHWLAIDLGANYGKSPAKVSTPENAPDSAILWAASYFCEWVRAMDSVNIPQVWVPGYRLNVSNLAPWTNVPLLYWFKADFEIQMQSLGELFSREYWSVPVILGQVMGN